jgi:hypothetical protein
VRLHPEATTLATMTLKSGKALGSKPDPTCKEPVELLVYLEGTLPSIKFLLQQSAHLVHKIPFLFVEQNYSSLTNRPLRWARTLSGVGSGNSHPVLRSYLMSSPHSLGPYHTLFLLFHSSLNVQFIRTWSIQGGKNITTTFVDTTTRRN